jgi:hypothetical protein
LSGRGHEECNVSEVIEREEKEGERRLSCAASIHMPVFTLQKLLVRWWKSIPCQYRVPVTLPPRQTLLLSLVAGPPHLLIPKEIRPLPTYQTSTTSKEKKQKLHLLLRLAISEL